MSNINNLVKMYSQQLSNYTLINLLDRESSRLKNEAVIAKSRAIYYLNKCSLYAALLIKRDRCKKPKKKRLWSTVQLSRYWEDEVQKFNDYDFKNIFRISRNTFNFIKNRLKHLIRKNTTLRSPIRLDKRLAIALYALGSSTEYRKIASMFGVGRTTVGEIVLEICQEIFNIFESEYLIPPSTAETVEDTIRGFEMLGFPQCIGAIGGCHIEVQPPKLQVTTYTNTQRWHSVILLAIVDYRFRFTYLNVGSPGSMAYSNIFKEWRQTIEHQRNNLFKNKTKVIQSVEVPILLIGNSAFELSDKLMKPYPSTIYQSNHERIFNYQLSKCQSVVDTAFVQIKARFRRIGKRLIVNIDNTNHIIKACCILHNICNQQNDSFEEAWFKDFPTEPSKIQPHAEVIGDDMAADGYMIRNAVATYLALGAEETGGTDEKDNTGEEDTAEKLSLKSEN